MTGVESQEEAVVYDGEEVMSPDYKVSVGMTEGGQYVDLHMQLFDRTSPDGWTSLDEGHWHHVARIEPGWISSYPIYTNPHTLRYRDSKHGGVTCICHETRTNDAPPTDIDGVLLHIARELDGKLYESCESGLGLVRQLSPFWSCLRMLPDIHTLLIVRQGSPSWVEGTVTIAESDLDEFRRTFLRITRVRRKNELLVKKNWVVNKLLSKLMPDRIIDSLPNALTPTDQMAPLRRATAQTVSYERRSRLTEVKHEVSLLAQEVPKALIELHAEIERVTLSQMIQKLQQMLDQGHPEAHWQRFFEDNTFILSMVFARPVTLLRKQFHARGSQLDGAGAHIGDLLFTHGRELALVEIKTPSTHLMRAKPYRNQDVYAPHLQLSGAITQVLHQQSLMRTNWLVHRQARDLQEKHSDTAQCVVIIGTTPTEEARRLSFELFRSACKDVEVVTFNELLGKLQLLAEHLAPKVHEQKPSIF